MATEDDPIEQLVTANRILANEGFIQGFGHVSVRVPDSNQLLISEAKSPALITANDIVCMDFSGNLAEEDRGADTYKETAIHRSIYRNRDDVNAVVHHHAPPVMPFTITDVELRPAFHMGAIFHSGIPTFNSYDPEFGRLVVSDAEAQRMADVLGDHRAQLLEGHGANVVGSSIEEAICSTAYFVKNARYQFQAEQLGTPSFYEGPDDSLESMVNDIVLAPVAVERMWTYLSARASG